MTTALDLNACIDRCNGGHFNKKQLDACVTTCENTFLATPGNTETPDGSGGKVFRDPTGAEVIIDSRGGKVFVPAPG